MKKIIFLSLIILVFSLITSSFVLAQDIDNVPDEGVEDVSDGGVDETSDEGVEDVPSNKLNNPLKNNPINKGETVSDIIAIVIRTFLGIIGTISLVIFIYAGLILLTSQGNPTKIKTGKDTMLWATLGILLVFASYTLLKFVFEVVGI